MESPPRKLNIGRDRISMLPDELLLEIIERLDLPEAVRAGAVSMRWQHLLYRLSRLHLGVCHFQGATPLEVMDAFTSAAHTLLSVVPLHECDCESDALKTLILTFYMSSPHLSTIGRTVEDLVRYGDTECLEFCISARPASNAAPLLATLLAELGKQFMSFSRAYPTTFQWLTRLTLKNLAFGHSDITELINACDKLKHLTLRLRKLNLIHFCCQQIELISVPELRTVMCSSRRNANLPVRFEIQPEQPKQLTAIFRNLANVHLFGIFPECDLSWTLFILEAAPALQKFKLSQTKHACEKKPDDTAEKTNVVWEPSKDKHLNLKLLMIFGFEEEVKVTNYIRLVMEHAAGLKRIELHSEDPCKECNAIDPMRSQVDEASRHRIKEQLMLESSSAMKRIIC
ncbi:hypothetical protein VPH35_068150 [Triticum aestivum]